MTQVKQNRKPVKRTQQKDPAFRIMLGLGLGALLIMIVATLLFNRSQQANSTLTTSQQALLIREDSPTRGPADAPVTLVEFLDPECEACRAAHPAVERILEEYDGQILYVVRYVPNHRNSMLGVAATEAAGEQGMYWEMQEILFANQPEWGEQSTPQTALILSYAEQLGLDMEQFIDALQDPAYAAKAERDRQDGLALNVRGTPTFFVNGQPLYGMNEQQLRSLIDQALA